VLRTLTWALVGLVACTTPPPEPENPQAGPVFPQPGPTTGGTPAPVALRLATTPPTSLDPRDLDSSDSLELASQLFDGLVAYDPVSMAPVPAAAARWDVLDDGTRFVFEIRHATFHDGTPVRAADFVTAWNRLADPAAARPYSFLLEAVKGFKDLQTKAKVNQLAGVAAPKDRVLEVTLNRSWPDFVSLLGHPALSPVPPAASQPGFGSGPVGNGPFRLAAPLQGGTPLVMQRFEGYYGIPPPVDSLEFRTYQNPDEGWPEFIAGSLDVAPIPGPLLDEARSQYGGQGIVTLARLLYCGFNESEPRFQDPAFRGAASLALDRPAIVEDVYGGVPTPATGIVPPTISGHDPAVCGDLCLRDVARARTLVRQVPREDRSFHLDYAASPVADALAATISSQLGEAGLTVTPRPHDEAGYRDILTSGAHEMFCLVWVADYPRQQALLEPLLLSGSPDNQVGVEDPRLDGFLEEARGQPRDPARRALYVQAERRALAAMHLVPVAWFRSHLAAQPYVEGFAVDPLARFDAATLSVSS
jgi:oligopeptide transport system substrate-binding protein